MLNTEIKPIVHNQLISCIMDVHSAQITILHFPDETSDAPWLEVRVSSQHNLKSIKLSTTYFELESFHLSGAKIHGFELSSHWWAFH